MAPRDPERRSGDYPIPPLEERRHRTWGVYSGDRHIEFDLKNVAIIFSLVAAVFAGGSWLLTTLGIGFSRPDAIAIRQLQVSDSVARVERLFIIEQQRINNDGLRTLTLAVCADLSARSTELVRRACDQALSAQQLPLRSLPLRGRE